MDRRPHDIPIPANHAKKRSRDELNIAETDLTETNIPPALTPMVSPEPQSGIPMPGPTIPLNPLTQQSQPAAGSYIHEPILTTDYSEVEIPSSASVSSEEMPRRKVSRRDSAGEGPDTRTGSSSSISPTAQSGEVRIDEWTLHLGIGWLSSEGDSIAESSLRGHQKYIQNHYPLSNVKIVAYNKQHCMCLVESAQGWYLFDEDLKSGRLLAREKEEALRNAAHNPIIFKDQDALKPKESGTNSPSEPTGVSHDSDEGMVVGTMDLD